MTPFSLARFGLTEMLRLGPALRSAARGAGSLEEAGRAVVGMLFDGARDADGARECVLVRFYKTHPFAALPPDLQAFARDALDGAAPTPAMKCLTLLATAGSEPAWNDRRRSAGHRAIPLPSVEMVEQAPMIAELVRSIGVEIEALVSPRPDLLRGLEGKTYNVFHVPEARGSAVIPAQGFVDRYGVRSVVGFGGVLVTGELYAVILFTRVPVSAAAADRFRNIALDLKIAVSHIPDTRAFAADPATD